MLASERKKYTVSEFLSLSAQTGERMELIQGNIICQAAPSRIHQQIVGRLFSRIDDFITENKEPCEVILAPFDVVLEDDVVQPDVMVICDPEKLSDTRCTGAPDWVMEVTSSNYRYDYFDKLNLYRQYGVREYWIINPEEQKVFVYFFEQIPNTVMFYSFDQQIPVNIYQNAPVQLSVCIGELLHQR